MDRSIVIADGAAIAGGSPRRHAVAVRALYLCRALGKNPAMLRFSPMPGEGT